ncbi:MAG: glycosyltransferase family 39 protein, partial [Deltaproteobacteria bacterium]|nr:glycosyltransferase family 39 protein [Deltaproteobacteria bacterium]
FSVSALHHLIFGIFPEDHIYILFAHSIIGAAGILLMAATTFRLFRDGFAAAALSAFLAFTPLFIRDHNSETILVPALFWMFSAILFIQSYAEGGKTIHLIASAANLALAILSRPEFMLLAPFTLILFAAANGKFKLTGGKILAAVLTLIPFLAIFSANVFRLKLVMEQEIAMLNFEDMTGDIFHRLASILTSNNLVFHPSLFPAATVFLALASPFVVRQPLRKRSIMLLLISLPWFAVYFADFNYESMMRLHIPGAVFVTAAASSGFSGCTERLKALFSRRYAAASAVAAVSAIWLASSIHTVEEVFALTNSDEEEAFFRESIAALPDERIAFVRLGYGDAPEFFDGRDPGGGTAGNTGRVHRFYPDYLLKKRGKENVIMN